ncbi:MAG: YhbY family RNA-binding protein [Desulfobulbus sp.]|uniref:YhbY family RNA-binding protein n=1 Tax=Desulfobulbus sp. TaxID=895 RepID=UPI00284D3FC1|nr:YhbY family RNA-binding protein [Desulfobulbus sp.]MDR2550116.1 YhbY family RNA-binding protein [Desulfobulbus sp.]
MSEQTDTAVKPVELTGREKKILRGLGHSLEPAVYTGKEGLTPALVCSMQAALKAHELIKVKIGQNYPVERNEAGQELAEAAGASLIQAIGRTLLLYRPNPDLPEARRISLTSGASLRQTEKNMRKGKAATRTKKP